MITGNMLIMFIIGFIIFCFYIAGLVYAIYWGHSTQREEMMNDPELRDYWVRLQLLKSGLTDESLGFLNSDISTRVSRELGRKPRELQKHSLKKTSSRFFISVASSFSLVFIISLGFLVNIDNVITPDEIFAMETSEQIKEAIYSPEALEVLDNAFSGMSVSLEKLGSGNNGQLYANYKIPPNYDSMIAKLITVAQTRDEAIRKMQRALDEFVIDGIKTTIPFHKKLMKNENFIKGNYTTKFLDDFSI